MSPNTNTTPASLTPIPPAPTYLLRQSGGQFGGGLVRQRRLPSVGGVGPPHRSSLCLRYRRVSLWSPGGAWPSAAAVPLQRRRQPGLRADRGRLQSPQRRQQCLPLRGPQPGAVQSGEQVSLLLQLALQQVRLPPLQLRRQPPRHLQDDQGGNDSRDSESHAAVQGGAAVSSAISVL